MKRWLIWILTISIIALTMLLIIGSYMMPDSSQKVLDRLSSQGIEYTLIKVPINDSSVVGAITFGDSSNPPLLLIHGSPGDWSAWENIIANDTILSRYYVIAIDRPGYGATSMPAQADLKSQAEAAWAIINNLELKGLVVVGHSYGGAVVEQLLVDNEDYFALAFLVAGTISPDHMQARWYNKVANWWVFQRLLSSELLSSNIEMMGLPNSLQKIEVNLNTVDTPIILMQGTQDVLVPFESVEYFRRVKPDGVEYILLDGMNHFIPWSHPQLINNVLLDNSNQ